MQKIKSNNRVIIKCRKCEIVKSNNRVIKKNRKCEIVKSNKRITYSKIQNFKSAKFRYKKIFAAFENNICKQKILFLYIKFS